MPANTTTRRNSEHHPPPAMALGAWALLCVVALDPAVLVSWKTATPNLSASEGVDLILDAAAGVLDFDEDGNPTDPSLFLGFELALGAILSMEEEPASVLIREAAEPVELTISTGHVIGATYRSSYWGGEYKVIGPHGELGVVVECVVPGAGAHSTVGERWTHRAPLDPRDKRVA